MINNRQNGNGNGRRRGRSGSAPRPSGGQPDRGSRLDNRARGNASQLHEKYKTLAADAQRQGDRVMTEYYHQFADHYFRVLSENRSRFEEQQPRRDRFDGQGDEYEEGEAGEGFEERPLQREQERGEGEGQRDAYRDRARQDRGDGNRDNGRSESREGRPDGNRDRGEGRGEARHDMRAEGVRGLEGPRADAGRDRQDREPRPPRDGFEPRARRVRGVEHQAEPRQGGDRQDGDQTPVAVRSAAADSVAAPVVHAAEPAAPAAELPLGEPVAERRPRGRPRKVAVPVEAADGSSASERIEMDRLPPALSDAGDAPAVEVKPRRTRRPRGETAAI